ncbi:MAG: phosphomannomutase/phosphoglucomutase [Syntrophobacteraceae bacterium]|nr:phosphomannomutase/phosphoglucomutase [Syntrophobacteraceae bacterium]
MEPKVFREYDIRGIVGKEIEDQDVVRLGKAFGTHMMERGRDKIVVGRDCRLSSGRYRDLLLEGLISTGMDVTDIGVCPTPLLYFAIRHLDRCGGVMITASHNPPDYNGFKICVGYDTIFGIEIQRLREKMEEGVFVSGRGKEAFFDIVKPYTDYILGNIRIEKKLRVGVDAGNATAGPVVVPLLDQLGCEVFPIFCDMDGNFPNHEPDPTILENLNDLISLVRRERLNVGLAFDGDCDRLGVVDHRGEVVFGDRLMILFAREILARRPGATFISEVKCSQVLYDDIRQRGGKVIMWKVGHSLIKAKMREVDAVLAGEMSGHMFFKDRYFGFDDGIYASCRLLEILSQTGKTIPQLLEDVPKTFATPEIRVDCPDELKFRLVEKAREEFLERGYSIIDVDGVRVEFPEGWGLVRASNTQPVLVLRFEALSGESLEEIRNLVEEVIDHSRSEIAWKAARPSRE